MSVRRQTRDGERVVHDTLHLSGVWVELRAPDRYDEEDFTFAFATAQEDLATAVGFSFDQIAAIETLMTVFGELAWLNCSATTSEEIAFSEACEKLGIQFWYEDRQGAE